MVSATSSMKKRPRTFSLSTSTATQAVIAVHVDKEHIHAVSDRLCREHGLSVIMTGQSSKAISYIEWLKQSKGQPTFRTMLEADLRTAIEGGQRLPATCRPYKKHPKYTGFLALYVHYLYVLGKIEKRQYPPRMTPQLRKEEGSHTV